MRLPSPRLWCALLAATCVAAMTGCSEPETAPGTRADGEERVVELITNVAAVLPVGAEVTPPERTGTVTCRRKLLGYAIGSTGAKRVEVPMILAVGDTGGSPDEILDAATGYWRDQGFEVDTSGAGDDRFPKVRARTEGYEVVVTALRERRQVNLYAVSPCLDG